MREFSVDAEKLVTNVQAKLIKDGFVYPTEKDDMALTEDEKSYPKDVANLSNDQLLNKLSIFTSLYASAAMNEAKYMIIVSSLERELEILKGNLFLLSDAVKIETRRKERDTNEKVVDLQEKLTLAEAYLRNYSTLRTNYEKYCFLFSRALTVRGEEARLQ